MNGRLRIPGFQRNTGNAVSLDSKCQYSSPGTHDLSGGTTDLRIKYLAREEGNTALYDSRAKETGSCPVGLHCVQPKLHAAHE
jgi:hypothetical protein